MSTASSTPAGGWYADPLDASLLRWWDGATWSKQTMPADAALLPSEVDAKPTLTAVPPLLTAVPRPDEPYVPPNSVFKLAETAGGEAYVPEWSGLADISDEVALSGVPVQLALTSTPSEPPIPVSADVFPSLRAEEPVTPESEPAWKVEAPLAAPVDQLFPVAPAGAAVAASLFPELPAASFAPAAPIAPAPPVVSIGAPISPPAATSTLSAEVFPVAAPVAPVAAPVAPVAPVGPIAPVAPVAAAAVVPQPLGESFPGIVPTAAPAASMPAPPSPVAQAPLAAAPAVALPTAPFAAPTTFAEPPAAPPAPAAAFAPAAPEAAVYAGPGLVPLGTNPVAPPEFQPFAASTPGATYVPLAPRPIPQPLQLGAPPVPAPPSELAPATAAALPSAPTEYWPTQGTPPGAQYQPNPGDYVPFDPSSVHLEPVPVIPFSSRDPYNSASTARPGMRAYAAAPIGPTGSTWTGGVVFMLLAPLIQAAAFFAWIQLVSSATITTDTLPYIAGAVAVIGLLSLAAAQFDRNALAKRGYFDLASPFWVLLMPPLVYLIVRATRLRGQGRGGALAIIVSLLSSVAASGLLAFALMSSLTAPTPARVAEIQSSIEAGLASKNVTATVSCPNVTSLAQGSTFVCTATTSNATLPLQVTITDWVGGFTVKPTTASGTTT